MHHACMQICTCVALNDGVLLVASPMNKHLHALDQQLESTFPRRVTYELAKLPFRLTRLVADDVLAGSPI